MDFEEILTLAEIRAADHDEALALLSQRPSEQVVAALNILRVRLGKFGQAPTSANFGELAWLSALLRFLPEQLAWYQAQGIPSNISAATVADIGRHLAISRVSNGNFSLETWRWLTEQATGTLYQLGRLQFHLQPGPATLPGLKPAEYILGVHIPEIPGSPLSPEAVQSSLVEAKEFFANYFPHHGVRIANCISWLLDPYLTQSLPAGSNIAQFVSRFTPYGELLDTPSDALYFTFRSRDLNNIQSLPRKTLLQQVVAGRIEDGGSWQVGQGYLLL